jgi:hypothetical protein
LCISQPAGYLGARSFEIGTIEPCGWRLSAYEVCAYSIGFVLIDHDIIEPGDNESGHVPVHAACLKLYKRNFSDGPTTLAQSHRYVDALARMMYEYEGKCEELSQPEFFNEILELKADYGALQSFNWANEDQVPAADDFGAFVYDANCSNKVRYHHEYPHPGLNTSLLTLL